MADLDSYMHTGCPSNATQDDMRDWCVHVANMLRSLPECDPGLSLSESDGKDIFDEEGLLVQASL